MGLHTNVSARELEGTNESESEQTRIHEQKVCAIDQRRSMSIRFDMTCRNCVY